MSVEKPENEKSIMSINESESKTDVSVNEANYEQINFAEPSQKKLSEDEAMVMLDGHRCAICQKTLIQCCRIDCGHAFCRHCLNTDRDNSRNEVGKATCFICDALITEISYNPERDKEIDDLFEVLTINKRLGRARAKSERKIEEENFSRQTRQARYTYPNANSNDAGGDASHICSSIRDEDEGIVDRNDISWNDIHPNTGPFGESRSESTTPTYFCRPYPNWLPESMSHTQEMGFHMRPREVMFEDEGSNSDGSTAPDENITTYNPPLPQPIVVHHTVQHIYHTVAVNDRNTNFCESSNMRELQPRHEFRRHANVYQPTYRDQLSLRRPSYHQDFTFHSHYRCSNPTYGSAGYYSHCNWNTHAPQPEPLYMPPCPCSFPSPNYPEYGMNRPEQQTRAPFQEHYHNHADNHELEVEEVENRPCTGREYDTYYECGNNNGMNEFHTETFDGNDDARYGSHNDRSNIGYDDSRSFERLSSHNSPSCSQFHHLCENTGDCDDGVGDEEDTNDNYYENQSEPTGVITLNVTIPISIPESMSRRQNNIDTL